MYKFVSAPLLTIALSVICLTPSGGMAEGIQDLQVANGDESTVAVIDDGNQANESVQQSDDIGFSSSDDTTAGYTENQTQQSASVTDSSEKGAGEATSSSEETSVETSDEQNEQQTYSIENAAITGVMDRVYNGTEQTQDPKVSLNDVTLVENEDYFLTYIDNVNKGTATMTITGMGNYVGTVDVTFTIAACPISEASIEGNGRKYTYTGRSYKPSSLTVSLNETKLVANKDYRIKNYSNGINAGSHYVSITGLGNFTGTSTLNYTVLPASIESAQFDTISGGNTYDGTSKCPQPRVYIGIAERNYLTANIDYTLSYENNVNAGTATVIATGKGNYKGSISKDFSIDSCDLSLYATLSIPVCKYNGEEQKPLPTITFNNKRLRIDEDYTVEYSNNVEVGKATIKIVGKGNFKNGWNRDFTIQKGTLNDALIEGFEASKHATGQAVTQDISVRVDDRQLTEGTDYEVSYTNNQTIGTAQMRVKGLGNYEGSVDKAFAITAEFSEAIISQIPDQAYKTRSQFDPGIEPEFTVTLYGLELKGCRVDSKAMLQQIQRGELFILAVDPDYYYYYENNYNPGQANLIIVGAGDYDGEHVTHFNIIGSLASGNTRCYEKMPSFYFDDNHSYSIYNKIYNGRQIKPNVTVEFICGDHGESCIELRQNRDYSVSYSNNVQAGTATITITGKGHYKGTIKKTFKILYDFTEASTSKIRTQKYSGKAITPKPKVKLYGKTLVLGKDYTLSYSHNKSAGEAIITIKGKGLYTGSIMRYFKIKASMKYAKVSKIAAQVPTSSTIKPKPVIKIGGKRLKLGRDYTLSYKNNTRAGRATIIIRGKGCYSGKKKVHFKILPKGSGSTITRAEYNRIKTGMTYRQVKCLVGGPGELVSEYTTTEYDFDDSYEVSYERYEWRGNNRPCGAAVEFEDGYVVYKTHWGIK